MKSKILVAALLFSVVLGFSNSSLAQQRPQQNERPTQGQPPQEAFDACQSKQEGDKASFISPRGDLVEGTCEQKGDQLVLVPRRGRPCHDDQRQEDNH